MSEKDPYRPLQVGEIVGMIVAMPGPGSDNVLITSLDPTLCTFKVWGRGDWRIDKPCGELNDYPKLSSLFRWKTLPRDAEYLVERRAELGIPVPEGGF